MSSLFPESTRLPPNVVYRLSMSLNFKRFLLPVDDADDGGPTTQSGIRVFYVRVLPAPKRLVGRDGVDDGAVMCRM